MWFQLFTGYNRYSQESPHAGGQGWGGITNDLTGSTTSSHLVVERVVSLIMAPSVLRIKRKIDEVPVDSLCK